MEKPVYVLKWFLLVIITSNFFIEKRTEWVTENHKMYGAFVFGTSIIYLATILFLVTVLGREPELYINLIFVDSFFTVTFFCYFVFLYQHMGPRTVGDPFLFSAMLPFVISILFFLVCVLASFYYLNIVIPEESQIVMKGIIV